MGCRKYLCDFSLVLSERAEKEYEEGEGSELLHENDKFMRRKKLQFVFYFLQSINIGIKKALRRGLNVTNKWD